EPAPVRGPLPARRLPVRVRLLWVGHLLVDARVVARGELRDRVADAPVARPRAHHQDDARSVAGAEEAVLRPGGTVEEVAAPEGSRLALDEQRALAGEYEESFLLRLRVVEAVGLPRLEDVQSDAELLELGLAALE